MNIASITTWTNRNDAFRVMCIIFKTANSTILHNLGFTISIGNSTNQMSLFFPSICQRFIRKALLMWFTIATGNNNCIMTLVNRTKNFFTNLTIIRWTINSIRTLSTNMTANSTIYTAAWGTFFHRIKKNILSVQSIKTIFMLNRKTIICFVWNFNIIMRIMFNANFTMNGAIIFCTRIVWKRNRNRWTALITFIICFQKWITCKSNTKRSPRTINSTVNITWRTIRQICINS